MGLILNTCNTCIFLFSFMLSLLDFCLTLLYMFLVLLKFTRSMPDNVFHVKTCIIWIVRPYSESASAYGNASTPSSLFVPRQALPKAKPRALEHSCFRLGNRPLVLSCPIRDQGIQKSGIIYVSLFSLTCANKKENRVNISYCGGKRWQVKFSLL